MKKPFPKDILLIMLLTVVSIFGIFTFPLEEYPLNIGSYILLAIFLPGYALMASIYPRKEDLGLLKRVFGSIIVSILLTLLFVIMVNYKIFGINFSIAFLIIGILTIILSFDALEGKMRSSRRQENNVKLNENIEIYRFQYSIKDLYIVIFLTLLSLTILTIPPKYIEGSVLYPLKTVFSYLLLFISGYVFWAALVPRNQLKAKRLLLTLIFGMVLFTVFYLLLKFNPLEGPSLVFTSILSIFIGLMCIIAILRRIKSPKIGKYLSRKYEVRKQEVKYEKVKSKSPINEKLIKDDKKSDILHNEQGSSNVMTNEPSLQKSPKRGFKSLDLLLIAITTVISIIFILNPILNNTILKPVLGIILILFLPGYAIVSVIFPRKDYLFGIERLSLSFAFPLIGLAIILFLTNFTTVVISLKTLSIVISAFTIIMVLIGYIRRKRVADDERFYVNFSGSKTRKILTIILILSIILAISTAVYIIFKPNQTGSTEFNLLSPVGNASVYPSNLTVGQNGTVILGIVNNESKTVDYHLVITSNGVVISEQNLTLTKGENKEIPYTFTAGSAGYKKIEFLLYKMPDNTNIYRSQYIYVNMV